MIEVNASDVRARWMRLTSATSGYTPPVPRGWYWMLTRGTKNPWNRAPGENEYHADLMRLELADGSDLPENYSLVGDVAHLTTAPVPEKTVAMENIAELYTNAVGVTV